MNRFFSFGCSFTQYKWPTWADILGKEFELFQNWGKSGAGNHFIFNSLIECHARNKITKNDTVGVMWTNMMREDRFIDYWATPGNIYSQGLYDDGFVKRFITVKGCYIRDLAFMSAVDQLLSSIGCQYFFLSMVDLSNPLNYGKKNASDEIKDVIELYPLTVNKIKPSIHNVIFNYNWESKGKKEDYHPLPLDYIEYLDRVLPDIPISKETRQWVENINFSTTEWRNDNDFPNRFGCTLD